MLEDVALRNMLDVKWNVQKLFFRMMLTRDDNPNYLLYKLLAPQVLFWASTIYSNSLF